MLLNHWKPGGTGAHTCKCESWTRVYRTSTRGMYDMYVLFWDLQTGLLLYILLPTNDPLRHGAVSPFLPGVFLHF